jgi:hypothetical protein
MVTCGVQLRRRSRNSYAARGVETIVIRNAIGSARRTNRLFAVMGLVLLAGSAVLAQPLAACCQSSARSASMHASMPCCAAGCSLRSAGAAAGTSMSSAIMATASAGLARGAATAVAAVAPETGFVRRCHQAGAPAAPSPPAFLLNAQLLI